MSRAAVVGLGLIGGSIALALSGRGWDRNRERRAKARAKGIDARESLAEALEGAEIVFAAVPTAEVARALPELLRLAPAGAVLTDAASRKAAVIAAADRLPEGARFVGGHPLAGSRTRGLDGADATLFRGRAWAVVPCRRSDPEAVERVRGAVVAMGARPVEIDAARHDALMNRITALPLCAAAALAKTASGEDPEDVVRLAGPGLVDSTRLAAGPSDLALELVLADPVALADLLDRLRENLECLAGALRRGDEAALRHFFDGVRSLVFSSLESGEVLGDQSDPTRN